MTAGFGVIETSAGQYSKQQLADTNCEMCQFCQSGENSLCFPVKMLHIDCRDCDSLQKQCIMSKTKATFSQHSTCPHCGPMSTSESPTQEVKLRFMNY